MAGGNIADGEIDYSQFSDDELVECLDAIAEDKYPLNFRNLNREIERRRTAPPAPPPVAEPPAPPSRAEWIRRALGKTGYSPNHIPALERVQHVVVSIALLGYGAYGLHVDDLYVPGRRGGIHFHGTAAWIVYAAFVFVAISLLLIVRDHYDTRDNEVQYKQATRMATGTATVLFVVATLVEIFAKSA